LRVDEGKFAAIRDGGAHRAGERFRLHLVAPHVREADGVEHMDAIDSVAKPRMPIDALDESARRTRRDDVVGHALNRQLRAREQGAIAPNLHLYSVSHRTPPFLCLIGLPCRFDYQGAYGSRYAQAATSAIPCLQEQPLPAGVG